MKLLFATMALAAVAVSAPAFAQTAAPEVSGYATLGYSNTHTDSVNLGAITGRLGVRGYRYFGVEGEASVGVTKDKLQGVNLRVKDEFAGYAVGFLPVSSDVDVFARVGYGTTGIKGNIGNVSASDNSESVNYGAGAQYFFAHGPNGVRVDFTRFDFTHDGGAANVVSLSYVRKFGR